MMPKRVSATMSLCLKVGADIGEIGSRYGNGRPLISGRMPVVHLVEFVGILHDVVPPVVLRDLPR